MAESQELLERKPPPYLWRWERKRVSLGALADKDASCFLGLLQHERSGGFQGPKFWQVDTDHVYESEPVSEEISESHSEQHDFNAQSIKSDNEQSMERISESLESEQGGSRTIHVEIKPFAREPINAAELMSAVMGVRSLGLLRWELDPDEPHTLLALNFLVTVDKDTFDVHNLAVEMDQTLLNFATCSVAIKGLGNQTHHYLLGGAVQTPEEPEGSEKMGLKLGSRMKNFFRPRSFFSSLFPFKSSRRATFRNGSTSAAESSVDDLSMAMQDISCDLKVVRKEIRDVQNHISFLSRHISNVCFLGDKLKGHGTDGGHIPPSPFVPMCSLPLTYSALSSSSNTTNYGSTVTENPNR